MTEAGRSSEGWIGPVPSRRPPRSRRGTPRGAARMAAACLAVALLAAPPAAAQEGERAVGVSPPEDTAVHEVAGLRVGSWNVTGLDRSPNASYSSIPLVDAYYQRGLGASTHLQLGLGLWRRGRVSGAGTVAMWVGPLFAGLKHYPLGGPEGRVDPYLSVSGGPALGFEQRRSSGTGALESGWTAAIGAGAEAGGGIEVDLSRNVGLTADARYQWVHYLAGETDAPDTYRGAVIGVGVTYRLDLR